MHIEDRKSSNKYIIGNEQDFSFPDFSYVGSISKGSPSDPDDLRRTPMTHGPCDPRADKNGSDRTKTGVV